MGLVSIVVATYANTATEVPIYLCASLYIVMVSPRLSFEGFTFCTFEWDHLLICECVCSGDAGYLCGPYAV